ncbi:MAG: TonB-dependent receptor [Bacteroidota bacterium]
MRLKRILPILLFLILPSWAFGQSGKITGVLTDSESGEPLIGATVSIQGTTKGAQADLDGRYLLLNVAPGTYTLEARYIGYATFVIQEVVVRTDLTTEQNFALTQETFEGEEVVVTAERQLVLKDVTSSEARVSSEEIEKLPVQEVGDVVQLQAGVNVGNNGGIFIRGGRASEVSYVVDGIRVSDDYNRSQGVRLENQAIQELQVISGSFNAEYGQALSGVINVVTKAGNNNFEGNVEAWTGGYIVSDGDLYDGLATRPWDLDPSRTYNVAASLSGPIIKDKLTFFASTRVFENEGWFVGRNAFSPQGPLQDTLALNTDFNSYRTRYGQQVDFSQPWYSLDTTVIGGQNALILSDSGVRDSSSVNMNEFRSQSFQGNLQWRYSNAFRMNLIANIGLEDGNSYSHSNRLVPLGQPTFDNFNYSVNLKTTITPSSKTFITLNAATRYNRSESFLFDDPYDPRYFNFENVARFGGQAPGLPNQFNQLSTANNRFFRSTESFIFKADISSQVNEHHFIKGGINVQLDDLNFDQYSLQPLDEAAGVVIPDFIPEDQRQFIELGVPDEESPFRQVFSNQPYTLSAFIQDKMEYEKLVINVGLRFDYFEPNARVAADPRDPDINLPQLAENRFRDENGNGLQDPGEPLVTRAEREEYWWRDVDAKFQLSPRFGVAYPINEKGVVYFSYGYFFQMPEYNFLYQNSQIRLQETQAAVGPFGNPDLDPERSIQYEVGLKQELFEGTALELVIFNKDSRDFVSSGPIQTTYGVPRYGTFINRDYLVSRGLTLTWRQLLSRRAQFAVDYTFSIVEGSNSDPRAEFFEAQGSGLAASDTAGASASLIQLIQPLDWDRRHILNSTFFYTGNDWQLNLVGRFLSGTPYTPDGTGIQDRVTTGFAVSTRQLRNIARLPARFTIDVNASKDFNLGKNRLRTFIRVFNLFDFQNINSVFADSGEPDMPLNFNEATADPLFFNDPGRYAEPRRIQIGASINF